VTPSGRPLSRDDVDNELRVSTWPRSRDQATSKYTVIRSFRPNPCCPVWNDGSDFISPLPPYDIGLGVTHLRWEDAWLYITWYGAVLQVSTPVTGVEYSFIWCTWCSSWDANLLKCITLFRSVQQITSCTVQWITSVTDTLATGVVSTCRVINRWSGRRGRSRPEGAEIPVDNTHPYFHSTVFLNARTINSKGT